MVQLHVCSFAGKICIVEGLCRLKNLDKMEGELRWKIVFLKRTETCSDLNTFLGVLLNKDFFLQM